MSKKLLSLALSATLLLVPLAGCNSSSTSEEAEPEEQQQQIANPFVDCASAAEAAQIAGFEVTFPEAVPGYSERIYQAVEGQMAQCFYAEGDQDVLIRKSVDDGSGDVSGDYNSYSETKTVTVGDIEVTEKGEDGLVHVAIWSNGGYLFAIDADAGLEPDVIEALVASTM